MVGLENTGSAVADDPDQQPTRVMRVTPTAILPHTAIASSSSCSHRQSREVDQEKRKELVWDIDMTLQEEGRPAGHLPHPRATCWHPTVKGLTTMVNSI
jgi:peptide/nickel transport system substrate-binding protein